MKLQLALPLFLVAAQGALGEDGVRYHFQRRMTNAAPISRELADCDALEQELDQCLAGLSSTQQSGCVSCLDGLIPAGGLRSCDHAEDICQDFDTCDGCGSCVSRWEIWTECVQEKNNGCNLDCSGASMKNIALALLSGVAVGGFFM